MLLVKSKKWTVLLIDIYKKQIKTGNYSGTRTNSKFHITAPATLSQTSRPKGMFPNYFFRYPEPRSLELNLSKRWVHEKFF